jgi:DNA polymerase-1
MSESKPLILVDGSAYLFRAFHGLPPLTNSKGQPTGAIYGVINMLRSLIAQYQPSHIAVVFDAKGKTFRDDMFSEYKANRPPMPEDLRSQIAPLHQIVEAMGLPMIIEPGVEADDVIGTLAKQATQAGMQTIISTGDKDMAQLVNQQVSLINTMKKPDEQLMDYQAVIDKFGIPPPLIIDWLALIGDKVDNIPGAPGVGDKSALPMLQQIGGIEAIYNNLDKIASLEFRGAKKMADKLREHEQQVRLSYQLATIKLDVPLSVEPKDLKPKAADKAVLLNLYREMEFKRWAAEVAGEDSTADKSAANSDNTAQPSPITRDNYQTILDRHSLDTLINELNQASVYALDTETTSINYMQAVLVGFSFAYRKGDSIHACYLPLAHDYPDAPEQLNFADTLQRLKPVLEDQTPKKIGQHLKYDKNVLANYQINLQGVLSDTMLESYVLNSTATRHDMDSMANIYLGHQTIKFEEVAGKGAKQLTFNAVSLEQAAPYAAEDAEVTLRLHEYLQPKLKAQSDLPEILQQIEIPLLSVLSRMETIGARIDSQILMEQSQHLASRMLALETSAYQQAGQSFNLNSPKQLQDILFEQMQLPVLKKTPKGVPSTAEEVLQELAQDYEFPRILMEYRGLSKLKNTYTDKLPQMIEPATNRVHTSYHQAVAATGRLSSTDPNLQNIPIRTEEGRRIRQAFVPEEGYVLVAADYSQIELRIMAHLSGDQGLLAAFAAGEDIHKATAAEVFSVSTEDVSSDQRRSAKAINFGLIYGMSAFGLSKQLNIPRYEAQHYMDRYFERYPGVLKYMDDTREQAKQQGYVSTLYGRRLYLPDIQSGNAARRKGAERAAINAPMQGTAADIIKRAMLDVDKWIAQHAQQDVRMIMQVHDELVFEIKRAKLTSCREQIIEIMQNTASLSVPLIVEAGTGKNWDEAH